MISSMLSETGRDLYWLWHRKAKWLLRIAKVTGDSEDDLHDYADFIQGIENNYNRNNLKQKVFDFKSELIKQYPELRPATSDLEITEEMKIKAREVDITSLIVHKRLWAVCPFHADKNASLYLKNNFAHCFACGKTADTIDLVKQIYNVDFKTAVKVLNNL